VQAAVASLAVDLDKMFRRAAHFVATDSEGDHALRPIAPGPPEHLTAMLGAEMANSIKNPVHAEAEPRAGLARGGGDGFKDRLHRLLLP